MNKKIVIDLLPYGRPNIDGTPKRPMTQAQFSEIRKSLLDMCEYLRELYFLRTGKKMPEAPSCVEYEDRLN